MLKGPCVGHANLVEVRWWRASTYPTMSDEDDQNWSVRLHRSCGRGEAYTRRSNSTDHSAHLIPAQILPKNTRQVGVRDTRDSAETDALG